MAPIGPRATATGFLDEACRHGLGHHELIDGEVRAIAPVETGHGDRVGAAWARTRAAVRRAGLPCHVILHSAAVCIDAHTVYVPDVILRCGEPHPPTTRVVSDPLLIVEVVSPSSQRIDGILKAQDYRRIATLRHYVLVQPDRIEHHSRSADGDWTTAVLRSGEALSLDPPGIEIAVDDLLV